MLHYKILLAQSSNSSSGKVLELSLNLVNTQSCWQQQKFVHWKAGQVQKARGGGKDTDEQHLKCIVATIRRDQLNKEDGESGHK